MPELRPITATELGRIPEIDVSEEGTTIYVQHGVCLERHSEPYRRLQRTAEDWVQEIDPWSQFVTGGGRAFGIFEAGRMIGFAVLRTGLEADTAQLAGLYVDRTWRRRGLASSLVAAVVEASVALGDPDPDLFEREPEDVHMSLTL